MASIVSATLIEAQEKQEQGVVFTVFVIDSKWASPPEDGKETRHVTIQMEKRYSEFLSLYWQLRRHSSVYNADFPRRLMWGSMTRSVVDDRTTRLGQWLQVVCADDAARTDDDFVAWVGPPPTHFPSDGAAPATVASSKVAKVPRCDMAPAKDAAPATSGDDADRMIAELRADGLNDEQLIRDLLMTGVEDPMLLRELYAVTKGEEPPKLEASCVARERWQGKWTTQLEELAQNGYTNKQQMAALLECFDGNVEEACRQYDEMHQLAHGGAVTHT